jgi:hypothetical protein
VSYRILRKWDVVKIRERGRSQESNAIKAVLNLLELMIPKELLNNGHMQYGIKQDHQKKEAFNENQQF